MVNCLRLRTQKTDVYETCTCEFNIQRSDRPHFDLFFLLQRLIRPLKLNYSTTTGVYITLAECLKLKKIPAVLLHFFIRSEGTQYDMVY